MENTEVQTKENVVPAEVATTEEIVQKTTAEPELSYEELKAKYEALAKKNEGAEEIAKRLKEEKSQLKRQEIEMTKQQQEVMEKQNFIVNTIDSVLNSDDGRITDEHIALAKEKGITPEQLELSLYKTKERLDLIYSKVGGKDRYFDMVDTVKAVTDEKIHNSFKQLLSNPDTYEIALEALEARYNKLTNGTQQVDNDNRIVPRATVQQPLGMYKNMAEYQKDMRDMRRLPSSKQAEAYKAIQAKLDRSKLV